MFTWMKKLFRIVPKILPDPVFLAFSGSNPHCPDCGSTTFFIGPQGGMCQNIKCAGCSSCFCVGPMDGTTICGLIDAYRIPTAE